MRHTIGQSELLYYLRPQSNQIKKAEDDSDEAERNVDCTEGMFVLPIQWMSDQIEQEEGKVSCLQNLIANIATWQVQTHLKLGTELI